MRPPWSPQVLVLCDKVTRMTSQNRGLPCRSPPAPRPRPVRSRQSPSSAFPRGNSQQSWQNPGLAGVLAKCKTKPAPFGIPVSTAPQPATPPAEPPLPPSTAIPGVIAAGQTWKTVWDWQGNNADGPIAGDDGTLLFANNDASNVMRMDPATGLATVIHKDVNTGGAVSRSKNGALFLVSRGLNPGVRAARTHAQGAGEPATTANRSTAWAAC